MLQRDSDAPMSLRYLDFVYQPINNEAGHVTGIFIEGSDVTARKRTEQALRRSEEEFRTFAQAIPNQVWAGRADGYLDFFSDQVYAYCGELRDTLFGQTEWTRIVHPDDLPRAGAAWSRSLSTGEVYETEFRIRRYDGQYRWFLVRAVPLRAVDGSIARRVGEQHRHRRSPAPGRRAGASQPDARGAHRVAHA